MKKKTRKALHRLRNLQVLAENLVTVQVYGEILSETSRETYSFVPTSIMREFKHAVKRARKATRRLKT